MPSEGTKSSEGSPAPTRSAGPPLVGRDAELDAVLDAIGRGGCVIAGAAGVGKSRLAAEAVERAAPAQGAVDRVVATSAAASVPFGAFAHLLSDASDETGPIPAYSEALRRRSATGPVTVLVDDAHLLDEASAALVLAVCSAGVARVVVTLRSAEAAPDAITALWKDLGLDRLDLGPLSRRELRELVDGYLGETAHADLHRRIYALTEGNPLYARELLLDARSSGALVEQQGRWRWSGRPPAMTRMRELIDARTRELSDQGRLALELLAVGGTLRLDELEALTGEDAVAELERAQLAIVAGNVSPLLVRVAHPMFGEVTAAGLGAAAARRHRRRLAESLARRGVSGRLDVLRLASLKLEAGDAEPDLYLRASQEALLVSSGVPGSGWGPGDPGLAIRLADAARPGLEAALCGARARMALSRYAEVEESLALFEQEAAEAEEEASSTYLGTRVFALHWSGTGTEEALELLDRAAAWHRTRGWAVQGVTVRSWILLDLGRPAEAVAAIEPLLEASDIPAPTRLDLLVVLGLARIRLARIESCEALEPEIHRLVDELEQGGYETGWARHMVDALGRIEALSDVPGVEARLGEARERAEERGEGALSAGLALVLGRLALIRGHPPEAIGRLTDAADGLVSGDPRNGLGLALTYLTRAFGVHGDASGAAAALERAAQVVRERPNHVRFRWELARATAWADVARGRRSAARERLLELADEAGEDLANEAEALYDALRLGAEPRACAERLTGLAARAENGLFDACAAHAAALAAADATDQLAAARRFVELGADLFAAEAATGAARAFAGEGRQSAARRAAALATAHAERCQGARTPALELRLGTEELTPREDEVAGLAARGLTNAEIAGELVLSVRTVETYVLRACQKLGVNRRAELAEVMAPGEEAAGHRRVG